MKFRTLVSILFIVLSILATVGCNKQPELETPKGLERVNEVSSSERNNVITALATTARTPEEFIFLARCVETNPFIVNVSTEPTDALVNGFTKTDFSIEESQSFIRELPRDDRNFAIKIIATSGRLTKKEDYIALAAMIEGNPFLAGVDTPETREAIAEGIRKAEK